MGGGGGEAAGACAGVPLPNLPQICKSGEFSNMLGSSLPKKF